jgi:hypothetical protein
VWIGISLACLVVACGGPGPPPVEPADVEAASPSAEIKAIDVFGSRKVSSQDVLATAGLKEGTKVDVLGSTAFDEQIAAAEERLKETYGFVFAKISKITYFEGPAGENAGQELTYEVYLTVDLVDPGDEARMAFAPAPTDHPPDPGGLVAAWIEYEARSFHLLNAGELDLSEGFVCRGGFHCALGFSHADLAAYEPRFIEEVPVQFDALRRVLREHADEKSRAAAAFLLAYGPSRQAVIDALVPSIDDPSSEVRNNVMRVLLMLQEGANAPLLPLGELCRALWFPLTTDRNKAGGALLILLEKAQPTDRFDDMKQQVLDECGEVLLEMVGLKQPINQEYAQGILEILTGQQHGRDQQAWRRAIAATRATH